jgi:hypothetical protein
LSCEYFSLWLPFLNTTRGADLPQTSVTGADLYINDQQEGKMQIWMSVNVCTLFLFFLFFLFSSLRLFFPLFSPLSFKLQYFLFFSLLFCCFPFSSPEWLARLSKRV